MGWITKMNKKIFHNSVKFMIGKINILSLLLFSVLFLSCRRDFKPVEILPGDVCDLCKMHITDKKFSAQYILKNRTVRKFDDIGCMVESYLKEKKDIAVIYVVDFETGEWIKVQDAVFIKGFTTPMDYGFAAFKKDKRSGINFEELVKEIQKEIEKEQ